MSEATPNPDVQADQVSGQEGSEEDAVAALLKSEQPGDEPKTDEPKPADEPDETEAEEADEADPEAEAEADELVEVEIGGKTFEVAPEVQKAVLRQADYSRKMNEAADVQKGATARMAQAERLVESAEKLSEVLSEVKQLDAQMKQFERVNWQQLRADNPAEYAALAADLQSVRLSRDDAMRKSQGVEGDIERAKQTSLATQRDDMLKALKKDLKGWGDKLGTDITQYAVSTGYSMDEIGAITDPKWVIAMDKARRYDDLQSSKTALKAKVQAAPQVSKPGSPRRADPKADVMDRLRKSKSPEDAIAAFMAR